MSTIDLGASLSHSRLSTKYKAVDKRIMKSPIKRTTTMNSYGERSIQFRALSPDKSSKESSPLSPLKYKTYSASKKRAMEARSSKGMPTEEKQK